MTTAYRCTAELLANIAKHASASITEVSTSRDGESLLVVVTDNGSGFELSKLQRAPASSVGFGLFSIRERMRALDGDFRLESRPGQGTKATLRLPLSSTEPEEVEMVR